jgi:hypothetical protein
LSKSNYASDLVYQFEAKDKPIGRSMFEDIAEKLKRTGVLQEVGLADIGAGTVDDIFLQAWRQRNL